MVRGCVWAAIGAMIVSANWGCGRPTGISFAPVTGRVTFSGQPLAAGTIHFLPDESQGTSGPMSTGTLQSDGSYILRGPGQHAGAIVGNHRVYLTMPPPDMTPTPVVVNGEVILQAPTRRGNAETALQIPKKYLRAETSEWTAAVVAGSVNLFDFEIKK